jgi:hypothetical protein
VRAKRRIVEIAEVVKGVGAERYATAPVFRRKPGEALLCGGRPVALNTTPPRGRALPEIHFSQRKGCSPVDGGPRTMSLEYLLVFALGLAVATVLATMGTEIVDFVIQQVKALMS